jgi:hypothetical protein
MTFYPAIARFASLDTPNLTSVTLTVAVPATAFAYSYACFNGERRRPGGRRLQQLSPFALVLMKCVSLYSMVLFTFSTAAVFHRDWRLLIESSGAALFLASCFMAGSAVSARRWAPHVPLWIILLLLVSNNWLADHFSQADMFRAAISRHALSLALSGIALSPLIAWGSAAIFAARKRR